MTLTPALWIFEDEDYLLTIFERTHLFPTEPAKCFHSPTSVGFNRGREIGNEIFPNKHRSSHCSEMWINLDLDLNKIKLYWNLRYRQQTAASRLKLPAKNSYTPLVTYLQARAAMTVSRWYVNDSLIGSNEYASDPGGRPITLVECKDGGFMGTVGNILSIDNKLYFLYKTTFIML